MKIETETVTRRWYMSSVDAGIRSMREQDAPVIEAADKEPLIWQIVSGTKSRAWGKSSHHYPGGIVGRSNDAASLITRAACFLSFLNNDRESFFQWSARFTLKHFHKKLLGGFFQQFDGKYNRGCTTLDFTRDTREEVIDKFLTWCNSIYRFPTAHVMIDKKIVRRYDPPR